ARWGGGGGGFVGVGSAGRGGGGAAGGPRARAPGGFGGGGGRGGGRADARRRFAAFGAGAVRLAAPAVGLRARAANRKRRRRPRAGGRASRELSRARERTRRAADSGAHHRLPASAWVAGRCGQVAKHHRAPDRRAGRLGEEHGAGAGEKSDQARRHRVGRDRRYGLLVHRRERDPDPWRRRQSKRQQVHRQFQNLSQRDQDQLDRGGIRRQLPRRRQAGDARAEGSLADIGALLAGAL